MNGSDVVTSTGAIAAGATGGLVVLYFMRRANRIRGDGRMIRTLPIIATTIACMFLGSRLVEGLQGRIGEAVPDGSTDMLIADELARIGATACLLGAVVIVIELVDLVRSRTLRARRSR